ncbi:MAG: protein translocase subunit SecDF, partial [Firmicutes bacterium]|nr:protein translocase subunit SecDF [Bacillota bacterium]
MRKKSSIIKFSVVGFFIIVGLVMCFTTFTFGITSLKSFATTIKLGLDVKGGVYAVYESESTSVNASGMEGTRARLQTMLVSKGYSEATVVKEGSNRLRVEVPDVDEPGKIFTLIGKPAELIFRDEAGNTVLTGRNVTSSRAVWDRDSQGYAVSLNLDSEGTRRFAEATGPENINKRISIITVVGGEEQTISAPTINSTIANGRAIITGMGTQENAQALA